MEIGNRVEPRFRRKVTYYAVAFVLLVGACVSAKTPNPNYRLDVVDQPVAVGAHSEFSARLTEVPTGQPVSGAAISSSTLQMTHYPASYKGSPSGGVSLPMAGEVKYLGPAGPGLYRFMGDVSMPGTWKLSVTSNIPGEGEAVTGAATFKAGQ